MNTPLPSWREVSYATPYAALSSTGSLFDEILRHHS